jgi:replicative DNA helicase
MTGPAVNKMGTSPSALAQTVDSAVWQHRKEWREEVERIILGTVLLEKDAYIRVAHILKPTHFIGVLPIGITHGEVWEAMVTAHKQGPLDIVSVTRILSIPRMGGGLSMNQIGYSVSQLTDRVASSGNLEFHSIILFEYALREQAVAILLAHGGDEPGDLSDLCAHLADETKDIHEYLPHTVSFLKQYGFSDVAEEMDELCHQVSIRLRQMYQNQYKQNITNQYESIKNGKGF